MRSFLQRSLPSISVAAVLASALLVFANSESSQVIAAHEGWTWVFASGLASIAMTGGTANAGALVGDKVHPANVPTTGESFP